MCDVLLGGDAWSAHARGKKWEKSTGRVQSRGIRGRDTFVRGCTTPAVCVFHKSLSGLARRSVGAGATHVCARVCYIALRLHSQVALLVHEGAKKDWYQRKAPKKCQRSCRRALVSLLQRRRTHVSFSAGSAWPLDSRRTMRARLENAYFG